MKILVVSDSHGAREKLLTLFYEYEQDVNAVIFLGDGLRDAQYLSERSGAVTVYRVSGNCDGYCPDALERQLLKLGGKNIFFTHGHLHSAKLGTASLLEAGKNMGADVVLYGHTHRQHYEKQDGIILANPGSLFSGRYGILEIQNGQIAFKFGEL